MKEINCPNCRSKITYDETHYAAAEGRRLICDECLHAFKPDNAFVSTSTIELPDFLRDTINEVVPYQEDGTATTLNSPRQLPKDRRFALEVINGEDEGQVFPIKKAMITLGRHPDADIQLKDVGVSREHARIEVTSGKVTIRDLESHNGTFVGQERVKHAQVEPDMEITLAVTRLILRQELFF